MQRAIRLAKQVVVAAAVVVAPAAAAAQTIGISTGVSGAGVPLADGSTDPRWTVRSVGTGNVFTGATVMYPAGMCCGMELAATTSAKWITDLSTPSGPQTGYGIGQLVTFQRQFDLTGYDLTSVSMSGDWRFADYFSDLSHGFFLNGSRLFGPLGAIDNWSFDHAFSVTSGFVGGVNTLEVRGISVNSTWDGLYVDGAVSGRLLPQSSVPEPTTVTLVAAGALLLAGIARRRRSA